MTAMTQPAPAAAGTLNAGATVTTVPLSRRRKVRYEFDTSATKGDLALPYRVSINGQVREAEGGSRALSAGNRKINLLAEAGDKIALFLNSDVHPDFRRNPVYALKVGDNDVLVTSCWRPMLGSIVHRAGLGIDVIHIANATQTVRINRVGLSGAAQNENVREAEKSKRPAAPPMQRA